jgi:hypothetical protein
LHPPHADWQQLLHPPQEGWLQLVHEDWLQLLQEVEHSCALTSWVIWADAARIENKIRNRYIG